MSLYNFYFENVYIIIMRSGVVRIIVLAYRNRWEMDEWKFRHLCWKKKREKRMTNKNTTYHIHIHKQLKTHTGTCHRDRESRVMWHRLRRRRSILSCERITTRLLTHTPPPDRWFTVHNKLPLHGCRRPAVSTHRRPPSATRPGPTGAGTAATHGNTAQHNVCTRRVLHSDGPPGNGVRVHGGGGGGNISSPD